VKMLRIILATIILLGLSTFANARQEYPSASTQEPSDIPSANLVLAFSQPVDIKSSFVEVRDSHHRRVRIGSLRRGENGTDLEIPLAAPLPPDVYTIRWQAVSTDGLVDTGGYDFTIEPTVTGAPTIAQQ
jgi:methionine-rich copper-binding protein CopC